MLLLLLLMVLLLLLVTRFEWKASDRWSFYTHSQLCCCYRHHPGMNSNKVICFDARLWWLLLLFNISSPSDSEETESLSGFDSKTCLSVRTFVVIVGMVVSRFFFVDGDGFPSVVIVVFNTSESSNLTLTDDIFVCCCYLVRLKTLGLNLSCQ